MHPGEASGHGVDFNETLAAKYPYQRAYLPVNRKEDGTLWDLYGTDAGKSEVGSQKPEVSFNFWLLGSNF